MAFVALTAASITLQGRVNGKIIVLPFTKATAVGLVTFTQDGLTHYKLPADQDYRIVDAYIGDSVNAADYMDFYLDGVQKIQMRLYEDQINNATTTPRCAPSNWIRPGTQISIYHYSA